MLTTLVFRHREHANHFAQQRIETVNDTDLGVTTYTYDAIGRRTVKLLSTLSRSSYSYDNASQLTSLFNPDGIRIDKDS